MANICRMDDRGSNPSGGEIFRNRLLGSWGLPSFYTMGTEYFPGVKRPGLDVDNPTTSSAEVKERVQVHLYSKSGLPWPVIG